MVTGTVEGICALTNTSPEKFSFPLNLKNYFTADLYRLILTVRLSHRNVTNKAVFLCSHFPIPSS